MFKLNFKRLICYDQSKTKIYNFLATKVDLNDIDETADILATSGVIIQDLKQSKMNSYAFNLESMFEVCYLNTL